MIYAYDRGMLSNAQALIGNMLDYAVYGLGYRIEDFYDRFLNSRISVGAAHGDSRILMGTSGIELCHDVLETAPRPAKEEYQNHVLSGKSDLYWAGWALAYYQWNTSMTYSEINDISNINSIVSMYKKYHEMDITQFADALNEQYRKKNPDSRLKTYRKKAGLSQSELAHLTGIPTKTIQQYEQRQKNINHANVDYMISLSRVLGCDIEMLIEKVPAKTIR